MDTRHKGRRACCGAMDFPVFTETYEIDGRIYRRNPFKRLRTAEEVEECGGDTLDLYADDEDTADDGPSCCLAPNVSEMSAAVEVEVNETKMGFAVEQVDETVKGTECKTDTDRSPTANEADGGLEAVKQSGGEPDESTEQKAVAAEGESTRQNAAATEGESTVNFDPKSKKWRSSVEVPHELIRFIVGVKGATKRKLETETSCQLTIPSKGNKDKPLEIVSTTSAESVERCRDRIVLLIAEAREKAPYTHFVSFPMNIVDIQNAYSQFVEFVQNDEELHESCREPSLFQSPKKLHFTLVMLSLLDSSERADAAKALEEIVRARTAKILDGQPLEAEIKGLEYMNDDPTRVRVLYASAVSEKMEEIANAIADGMGDAGLAPRRSEKVKLHLTLMNTKYAFEKAHKKIRMDVTKLMEKYGEYYFGHASISEVQISCVSDPNDRRDTYTMIASVKF